MNTTLMTNSATIILELHNQRQTHVVPHNPLWPKIFTAEEKTLRPLFIHQATTIEHIGSTAIVDMPAKPIIDIMILLPDVLDILRIVPQLEHLGYLYGGEFGISGRHFFCKGDRTHCNFHIHVYSQIDPAAKNHRLFQLYLTKHPRTCKAYAKLKQTLANQYPHDRTAYTKGKHDFIQNVLLKVNNKKVSE